MKMKKRKLLLKNIGIALSVLQFIISVIFCWELFEFNMLPNRYSIGITVILFLLCIITLLLQFRYKPGIFGKIISVIIIIALLFSSSIISDFNNTFKSILDNAKTQKEKINVYIMADREIPTDIEASDFTYGVLSSTHGESFESMMTILKDKFGDKPKTAEYKTTAELTEALYSGKVEAIILDESFISFITEIEEYVNFETETKILYSEEFSISIKTTDRDLDSDTLVVYITGNDQKGSVSAKGRTDVNILAVVNIKTKEILLISTPRDYYVNLKFDNGNYSSIPDKLTHSGNYGISVSMNTMETIYDNIDIDYYFRVNFTGFIKIVDALGGVDVYVPKNFKANGNGTIFKKGNAHLNGEQALDFVRERYAFANGDNRRGEAQMEVITALLKKIMSPSVISGYSQIIDSVQRYFLTDIPTELISSLVKMQIEDGAEWNITSASIEGDNTYEAVYSIQDGRKYSVALRNKEDEDEIKEMIQKVLDGEHLSSDDE